jgi:integrase
MASIDRRPNGKWRARWREYPGGPQKAKHFVRKLDAERHLVEVQHLLMSGTYVPPEAGRMRFGPYADVYLARQPWRSSTAEIAEYALTHARRVFEKRPLGTIRKGDVQAFVTGLKLAASTTGVVFQHVNSVFEAAVEDRLIVANPARGVKLPERSEGEIVPPTVEQVQALYGAAADWFRPAIVMGAGLGLRQAEASGITGDRIRWLNRTVRVDRQWITRRRRAEFGPPKTAAGVRSVPASAFVLRELAAHVGRDHHGYVLHRDGEPIDYNAFGYAWRRAADAAGLEGLRYHSLRHAFASMLIAGGCSVKAVQRALGHAKAATTLDLYAHLWPGDDDRIRQAVDLAFDAGGAEDSLRTAGGAR